MRLCSGMWSEMRVDGCERGTNHLWLLPHSTAENPRRRILRGPQYICGRPACKWVQRAMKYMRMLRGVIWKWMRKHDTGCGTGNPKVVYTQIQYLPSVSVEVWRKASRRKRSNRWRCQQAPKWSPAWPSNVCVGHGWRIHRRSDCLGPS